MTVNPGFGGQSFIESCLPKIEKLAGWIVKRGLKTKLEVDGGIAAGTVKRAVDAGATVLVAGTAVFGQKDYAVAIQALRDAAG
jgi:ribulose-phosphate 3-epimerase